MLQALSIGCGLTRALEDAQAPIVREMTQERQNQLSGATDDNPSAFTLLGLFDRMCPFYNTHIEPLWPQASDNCALTMVLMGFVVNFSRQLQLLEITNRTCAPSLDEMLRLACTGAEACIKEVKECCERGEKGPGGIAQLLSLARQFIYLGYDCFDPFGPETRDARAACLTNAWIGTFKITLNKERSTNIVNAFGSFSSTESLKIQYEGGVHYSQEEVVPGGPTNLTLHALGTASLKYHREIINRNVVRCTDPDQDLQSFRKLTSDSAYSTHGAYIISIIIQPSGQYMLYASTPIYLDAEQTDHEVEYRPSCRGATQVTDSVTKHPQPYLPPTLFIPVTGTLTAPDQISGSSDVELDPGGVSRIHVEWDFRQNKDTLP